MLTYAVCLFVAFLASFFILMNGLLVKVYPIFMLLVFQGILGFIYTGILLESSEEEYSMFSNDAEWGGFGFFNKDKFFDTFFVFGMSAGFWGSAGYIISLLFFSPVIVSASFLTEPFLGQLFGYWMNIDAFPGLMTWSGTVLVCLGILSIQRAEQ